MKCTNCETLYPTHYDKCPKCGSQKGQKEEFAHQSIEEAEEVEKVSAMAVNGDLDDFNT